jgi:hypothetical protein
MEETRRVILEKLCRRFAEEYGPRTRDEGDTERFDRLLALWIDFQRAIHLRTAHEPKHDDCAPWQCPDKAVRTAWDALTSPKNVLPLESLYYQLPEGQQMEMARKALQACRQRRDAQQAKVSNSPAA